METALFWIAWGLISFWALKTFYYSFSKEKIERLRKAALGINLAVFILALLPWLPLTLGGKSGLTLALQGNFLAVLFFILLTISVLLFLTKVPSNLKIAAGATTTNTFVLFVLMYQLRPNTFILSVFDIAPIIAVMFLLVGDLVVMLLWQQLQLKLKKSNRNGSIAILPILLVSVLILGIVLFFKINSPGTKNNSLEKGSEKEIKEADPGWVCAPTGNFSFRLNVQSSPFSEGNGVIVLTTKSGIVLVSKKVVDSETILKKHTIPYTKENNVFIYQLTSSLDSSIPAENPILVMTEEKNGFVTTIFYDLNSKKQTADTLKIIGDSIKEGCKNV